MSVPPAQYVGLARNLRRRIAAADAAVLPAMRHAVAPIQRRLQRYPHAPIRPGTLIDAARAWRNVVPFGRVGVKVDITDRRCPVLDDIRVVPAIYRGLWDDGATEPGLAVMLTSTGVDRGRVVFDARGPLVVLSLHAIARHYERSASTDDDAAVLAEIGSIVWRFRELAPAGGDFSHRGWLGFVAECADGQVALSVRTYWPDADGNGLQLAA